jgi:predicted ATPase
VLQALALRTPLVLVVDDLQWADAGSINLLFHLGRQLAGSRVLIVGAYRPEEVALGRRGERHPLDPVVNELRRDFGDISVDLGQAERRDFVKAFLDSEPNRLGPSFREMLYRQTDGHPLFTIELLRGLQERGNMTRDAEGYWVEGPTLDWETLPARVEAVIAERIGRLAEPLRAALRVASVEGEVFTAEVVAQVRGIDEREMLRRLSGELDRGHRLIQAQSIQRMNGQLLSHYRFRHILFQKYLYSRLDRVERVHLHEQVGTVLEKLYGVQEAPAANAVQLALHFQKAGITEKAVRYLCRAGERAVQLSAYREGIVHLERGLALLKDQPPARNEGEHLERLQQELSLQLALSMAWQGAKGAPYPEVNLANTRARELCQEMGKTSQLCHVVGEMAIVHYVDANHQMARGLAEEALDTAERLKDPRLLALSHWCLGFIQFALGQYEEARTHLQEVISFYRPQVHHQSFIALRGKDAGLSAMAYDAACLWCLGYPDEALKRSRETLALARALDHPYSLADVLCYGSCMVHEMRRDAQALKEHAEELIRLSEERLPGWRGSGTCFLGEALVRLGKVEEGIQYIRDGLTGLQSLGVRCDGSGRYWSLACAQSQAGRPEEALITVAEALAFVEQTDERYREAELHRLRGELLQQQGDEVEAEASFDKAIDVARRQHARSWELRATVSLCRLWQRHGKGEEARERLTEIYGWFTEGFDTPDLVEAKALLESLSS